MANLTGGQLNALVKKHGGEDGARRFLRGETVVVPAEPKKLLEFVGTVPTIAVARFATSEKFRKGKTVDGVTISWLGQNFIDNFGGLVETNVDAAELKMNRLLQSALDLPENDEPGIIMELRGKHKSKLAQFHQILAHKQRTKDFSWIVAYVRDKNGILWAVDAFWDGGGWRVGANSVDSPDGWHAGDQVMSR